MSITKVSGRIAGILGRPPVSASGIWGIDQLNKYRPLTIPGLQLWLDASDSSTLFDATTGGSAADADGQVARIEDKSGNGRHATQSTSGSQPLRKLSVQNGLDVVRFDGSDDFLTVPSSTAMFNFLHKSEGGIVFAVYKSVAAQGSAYIWCNNTNPTNGSVVNQAGVYYRHDNDQISPTNRYVATCMLSPQTDGFRMVRASAEDTVPSDVFNLISLQYDAGQASASDRHHAYLNGTEITGTENFGIFENASLLNVNATRDFHVFSNAGGHSPASGDFCEMLVYRGVMQESTRKLVESYLLNKWSI